MIPEPFEIALPEPPPGQGVTYQVGAAYTEQVVAVAFTLVTSAVVVVRRPLLTYVSPGGQTIGRLVASGTLGASVTAFYTYQLTVGALAATALAFGSVVETPLAIVPLRPGGRLVLSVDAMDAGDQLSAVMLSVWRRDLTARREPAERLEVDLVQVPPSAGAAGGLS